MTIQFIFCIVIIILLLYSFSRGLEPFGGIYLDNNATSEPAPGSLKIYQDTYRTGNSSSFYNDHEPELNTFKKMIGNITGTTHCEFNSGASEGNCNVYYSFNRLPGAKIIASDYEHYNSIAFLKTINAQLASPGTLATITGDNTGPTLVSIMLVNNETGENNSEIIRTLRARDPNIFIHSDVTQALCKFPIPPGLDFATGSFHKIGGAMGTGFIACSDRGYKILTDFPMIPGKSHPIRGGTINYPGIMISQNAYQQYHFNLDYNRKLINTFLSELASKKWFGSRIPVIDYYTSPYYGAPELSPDLIRDPESSAPFHFLILSRPSSVGTLLIAIIKKNSIIDASPDQRVHFCNLKLQKYLREFGVIVSIGSACGGNKPSHVLQALHAPFIVRCGVLRISTSDKNTPGDMRRAAKYFIAGIREQL